MLFISRTTSPSKRSMPSICPTHRDVTRWSGSARPSVPSWSAWRAVSWCMGVTMARSWWLFASSSMPLRSSTCLQERWAKMSTIPKWPYFFSPAKCILCFFLNELEVDDQRLVTSICSWLCVHQIKTGNPVPSCHIAMSVHQKLKHFLDY